MESTGDTRQVGLAWIPLAEIEDWLFWPKVLRSHLGKGLPAGGAEYLGDVNWDLLPSGFDPDAIAIGETLG